MAKLDLGKNLVLLMTYLSLACVPCLKATASNPLELHFENTTGRPIFLALSTSSGFCDFEVSPSAPTKIDVKKALKGVQEWIRIRNWAQKEFQGVSCLYHEGVEEVLQRGVQEAKTGPLQELAPTVSSLTYCSGKLYTPCYEDCKDMYEITDLAISLKRGGLSFLVSPGKGPQIIVREMNGKGSLEISVDPFSYFDISGKWKAAPRGIHVISRTPIALQPNLLGQVLEEESDGKWNYCSFSTSCHYRRFFTYPLVPELSRKSGPESRRLFFLLKDLDLLIKEGFLKEDLMKKETDSHVFFKDRDVTCVLFKQDVNTDLIYELEAIEGDLILREVSEPTKQWPQNTILTHYGNQALVTKESLKLERGRSASLSLTAVATAAKDPPHSMQRRHSVSQNGRSFRLIKKRGDSRPALKRSNSVGIPSKPFSQPLSLASEEN